MERKTIFLVDDDMTNLAAGKAVLTGAYKVFTINSGQLLLQMLDEFLPDMILLDVEMPGMSGYEAIKIIKSNPDTANIPIIFLTAHSDSASELEGLSLGAIDYITKPFSPPLLLKRIEVHLLVEAQKDELLRQQKELINFNNNLQEMVEEKTMSVLELQNALLTTMAELVEWRDDNTGGHIARTQSYLAILLNALQETGIYEDETRSWDMKLVLQSAQLHDVGKIAIKDAILLKPGKLTAEEFEQIKEHTTFGEKIVARAKHNTTNHEFLDYAEDFVAAHHEKWDGSGYPRELKGLDIPLLGRLMAVADVYDALVSDRPYKKAFPHEEAVRIIEESRGKHFDSGLIDIFLRVAGEFEQVALAGK